MMPANPKRQFALRENALSVCAMSDTMKVSMIGLGVMGAPIARHIATAGYPVTIYNRSPERLEKWLADNPALPPESPLPRQKQPRMPTW